MASVVDIVIGNSSSGLIEVPFLGTAVVNLGKRQKGRLTNGGVVHVEESSTEILAAIEKANSEANKELLIRDKNIFGDGNASQKILSLIKNWEPVSKKTFHDLNIE